METLKSRIIALLRGYIDASYEDKRTGVDEGIYDKKESKKYFADIEEHRKLVEEFENYKPSVYVYVEGGNIQGASGTEHINFNLFDKDNYMAGEDQDEFVKNYGTPKQWDAMIKKRTKKGELVDIY